VASKPLAAIYHIYQYAPENYGEGAEKAKREARVRRDDEASGHQQREGRATSIISSIISEEYHENWRNGIGGIWRRHEKRSYCSVINY